MAKTKRLGLRLRARPTINACFTSRCREPTRVEVLGVLTCGTEMYRVLSGLFVMWPASRPDRPGLVVPWELGCIPKVSTINNCSPRAANKR